MSGLINLGDPVDFITYMFLCLILVAIGAAFMKTADITYKLYSKILATKFIKVYFVSESKLQGYKFMVLSVMYVDSFDEVKIKNFPLFPFGYDRKQAIEIQKVRDELLKKAEPISQDLQ